ncbi:MAG: hypothetical protein NUV51_03965 [Sulfuricaulis sp.]|nr:hypothetical protein [Sulfuricaulis sp.]
MMEPDHKLIAKLADALHYGPTSHPRGLHFATEKLTEAWKAGYEQGKKDAQKPQEA